MANLGDLDGQSKKLEEMSKHLSEPMAVPLDKLSSVISDLDKSQKLKDIFGSPVSQSLGVVAVGNDLRLVDLNKVYLDDAQKKTLIDELRRVIDAQIAKR